jgi:hypothetical protein
MCTAQHLEARLGAIWLFLQLVLTGSSEGSGCSCPGLLLAESSIKTWCNWAHIQSWYLACWLLLGGGRSPNSSGRPRHCYADGDVLSLVTAVMAQSRPESRPGAGSPGSTGPWWSTPICLSSSGSLRSREGGEGRERLPSLLN